MSAHDAYDVAIVGGGPVGLLLANLLGRQGLSVVVLEARTKPTELSMAIGVTPPSLEILKTLGLESIVHGEGVQIERAKVFENRRDAGCLQFGDSGASFPWILSLPQSRTEHILEEEAVKLSSVDVRRGVRVEQLEETSDSVRLAGVSAKMVVGCDGAKSVTRKLAGIGEDTRLYRPSFTMADAPDETDLGRDAYLYFGKERPVESFPLPGGRRRWIVRTGWGKVPDLDELFSDALERLTGHRVPESSLTNRSDFRPYRMLARRYHIGRVALCGDSAHVLSPIGGQGMNIGFGDAAMLSEVLYKILREAGDVQSLMRHYEKHRRHVFNIAAKRAAIGMKLGTLTGNAGSSIRGKIIDHFLSRPNLSRHVARWFSMTNLPQVPGHAPIFHKERAA